MTVPTYELTRLDSYSFEHLANMLALKVLGVGHTGFGPGADGGRDGYFEGQAAYPSSSDNWSGTWYLQSKFHSPHLSADPQKWLLSKIQEELNSFEEIGEREWPDNWIVVTNIEPSGRINTGAFDKAKALVKSKNPALAKRFHIWGGRKVLDLIALNPEVGAYYSQFLSSGQVLSKIYESFSDSQATVEEIIHYLVATQFRDQQYTKLEQAGSKHDSRPGIHNLFKDLPYLSFGQRANENAVDTFMRAAAQNHGSNNNNIVSKANWERWRRQPARARIWFVKGGPGQGKSTLTQYICQIQRASLLLSPNSPKVLDSVLSVARQVEDVAIAAGHWPLAARIPVSIELRHYAHWHGKSTDDKARSVLNYLSEIIGKSLSQIVQVGTLKRAFQSSRWLFIFDGLDEVPADVKDQVAKEIQHFLNDILVSKGCDSISICTSRPQGYSGQFDQLETATIELAPLLPEEALACAKPVLEIDRSAEESGAYFDILSQAIKSPSVSEIMTTPLQSHIMAVVVRDGGRPPERRWALFSNFYRVIKKREGNKNHADPKINKLLQEGDKLIKTLHNRLGFELHSRAEKSEGAQTSLSKIELKELVEETVKTLQTDDVPGTVDTLMEATTDRLVLVSTPDDGSAVRFDIRPLQEFFAAEYIYETADFRTLDQRLRLIVSDSHWREVMHFLLSALVENERHTELAVAVSALVEADEGQYDEYANLSKRLAVGGILTSRLLKEGVLEADRRIRQQFRKCLTSLLGSISADRYLASVQGSHSRAWLYERVTDALLEQSYQENVGAARLAFAILPDDFYRLQSVIDRLAGGSADYRSSILESVMSSPDNQSGLWPKTFALSQLLNDDWHHLSSKALTACFSALEDRSNALAAARSLGLDQDLDQVLVGIFHDHRHAPRQRVRKRFGFLDEHHTKAADVIEPVKFHDATWKALSSASGVLRLAGLILGSAVEREGALDLLRREIEVCPIAPYKLPIGIQRFFDGLSWRSEPSLSNGLKETGGSTAISIGITSKGQIPSDDQLADLCREMPFLVLLLTSDKAFRTQTKILNQFLSKKGGCEILFHALGSGKNTIVDTFPFWGSENPALFPVIEKLRAIRPQYVGRPKLVRRVYPVQLRLPEERNLLPLAIEVCYNSCVAHNVYSRSGLSLSEALRVYSSDDRVLRSLIKNDTSAEIRIAAWILLVNLTGDLFETLQVDEIVKLYREVRKVAFAYAIFELSSDGLMKGRAQNRELAEKLLYEGREHFEMRVAVEPLLLRWREVSASPASDSDRKLWEAAESF